MNRFFRGFRWFGPQRSKEAELRSELEFHLEEEAEERRVEGASTEQAHWAARRDLGNVTAVQENTRAVWTWIFIEQLVQDIRYALRSMNHNRVFTALAALLLALGIGANTAIYSFLDTLLLRRLPVSDPQSLVVLNWRARERQGGETVVQAVSVWGPDSRVFPYPAFELFQKNIDVFSNVFGYCRTREVRTMNVSLGGRAEAATGELVSGDYFGGLNVVPAAGRPIIRDDDRSEAKPVAVVSHAFSDKHFGDAANAVGKSVAIDNLPFTIVGVAPPEFFGVDSAIAPDIYLPMHARAMLGALDSFGFKASGYLDKNYYWVEIMARLRPGINLARAQAVLAPQFRQWVATTATNDRQRENLPALVLQPGAAGLDTLRQQFSKPLYVLMTLVGLILAIACSNVANLLLARAASRRREIALRLTVGAGRLRVIRQLLTESILLGTLGGVLGLVFAIMSMRFLSLLLESGLQHVTIHAGLNWRVLCIAAGLSTLTGLLFGLGPALQATRVDVAPALKETRVSQPLIRRSFGRIGASQILILGQVAVSLLLLVAAGLFVRTLRNLQSVQLGFNRENVLLFQLDARKAGHGDADISTFYRNLRDQFAAIPGVRNVSLAETSLIDAGTALRITVPGGARVDSDTRLLTVGPTFFTTMQIPLTAGRDLDQRDRSGSRAVAVINERLAQRNFKGESPLGRHLTLWDDKTPARDMEIVGVTKNANYGGVKRKIPPVVYIPYDQGYPQPNEMVFALRTVGDPLRYVEAVRETVHRADPRVPVTDVRTQKAEIEDDIHEEIALADLCSAFAVLALTIACVGLYATMSYTVARRTGEIGIRMALGAQRGSVVRMVLREILAPAVLGLAVSLPVALSTSKFIESFLFGMKPNDPMALCAAIAVLLTAAIVAAYIPARRASRIDPMVALRHE